MMVAFIYGGIPGKLKNMVYGKSSKWFLNVYLVLLNSDTYKTEIWFQLKSY